MLNLSEVATAKNRELVQTYNELTGKSVKGFGSRAAGVKAVTKQLLLAASKSGNGEQPITEVAAVNTVPPPPTRKTKRRPYKRAAKVTMDITTIHDKKARKYVDTAPKPSKPNWRDQMLAELLEDPEVIKAAVRLLFSKS